MRVKIEFKGDPPVIGKYTWGSNLDVLRSNFTHDKFVPLIEEEMGVEVYLASDTVSAFWEDPEVDEVAQRRVATRKGQVAP